MQIQPSSGLRLRVRTLTEDGESQHHINQPSEQGEPILLQPLLTHIKSEEEQPLLFEPPPIILEDLTASNKKSTSPSSVVDYATRLHPTLLQHYYDMTSSLQKDASVLPSLAFQEVILGDIIGRGGFSFVHEIKYVKLQEIYDTGNEEASSRATFASIFDTTLDDNNSNSNKTNNNKPPAQRYVLKTLRPDLPEDEHNKGIIDLAVEAQFLAALSHPHILSLRGHANSDPLESRYFVILDRLTSTLDDKLKIWRRDVGINVGYWFGPYFGYCCGRPHVIHRIWMERFTVARDIASALQYLHEQDIVYRDLKPDNIGFNSEGELKMFDFGLAKRITNADKTDDELYNLTGNTGSLRYMAPEVALNKPYSLSVDAYSFGVLFWQLCALQVPYSGYSCKMHADLVVNKGYRPTPDASWPDSWCELMSQCWAADCRSRPSFDAVLKVMNAELEDWTAEGEDFLSNEGASAGPGGKDTDKIKAKKSKSVFYIKARRDRQTLDIDTRLAKPLGPTAKKHDAMVV